MRETKAGGKRAKKPVDKKTLNAAPAYKQYKEGVLIPIKPPQAHLLPPKNVRPWPGLYKRPL